MLVACATAFAASQASANLLISQYYEGPSGSGNSKFIELQNTGTAAVSLDAYWLAQFNNANRDGWMTGGSPSSSIQLPAVELAPGAYFLIKHAEASAPAYAVTDANFAVPGSPNNTAVLNFNGDDSVVLYEGNDFSNKETIRDAFTVTSTQSQGADKSWHRQSNGIGWDNSETPSLFTVLDFTGEGLPWATKTAAEVLDAGVDDPWRLKGLPPATPPSLEAFTLSNDTQSTVSPLVSLTITASGNPLEYIVSENADFTGAEWKAYAPSPAPQFELGSGLGVKTVYLKVRNANGESNVMNDAIEVIDFAYNPAVLITQYYEGPSNNKYLELSNTTAEDIALDGWVLARWENLLAESWKVEGSTPGSSISLNGLVIPAGGSIILAHNNAASPIPADAAALSNGNLSFNGNDSVTLHNGPASLATLLDAVGLTNLGNEGMDTSFVRLSTARGFGFALGSTVLDFPAVWQQVTTAEVGAAAEGDNMHLGTYPGGGAPLAGYALWASAYPGLGAAAEDDDKDGLANITEYAMGSDPTTPGVPYSLSLNEGKPRLVIPKGSTAAGDAKLTYLAEASTTLATDSWTSAAASVSVTETATEFIIDYAGSEPAAYLRFRAVLAP